MMFKVYFAEDGVELPSSGTYYVMGRDGLYIHKSNGIISGLFQVDKASFLNEVEEVAFWNPPRVPSGLIAQALLFFRRVYKKHHSEAAVLLHYNPMTMQYALFCPEQTVSGGGVNYSSDDRIDDDYQLVGSIHSHCGFGAYHSGTDIGDEETFDGLHVTIGHVDRKHFTFVASLVVNARRFPYVDPSVVVEGVERVQWQPFAKSFTRPASSPVVTAERPPPVQSRPHPTGMFNSGETFDSWNGLLDELDERRIEALPAPPEPALVTTRYNYGGYRKREKYFDLKMPDESSYVDVGFPPEWMDKVSKQGIIASATSSVPLLSGMTDLFGRKNYQELASGDDDANAVEVEGGEAGE